MMRLFFAVTIKEDDKILELFNLCKQRFSEEIYIKWTPTEQHHITTVFIGETIENIANSIINDCNNEIKVLPNINLQLEGNLVFYHNRQPKVIGIKFSVNEELKKLKIFTEEILRRYDVKIENRTFIPHLTFGRIKKVINLKTFKEYELDKNIFAHVNFNVNSYTLYNSTLTPQGPIYESLWKLNSNT